MGEKVKFIASAPHADYKVGNRGVIAGFCLKNDIPHAIVRIEDRYVIAPLSDIRYTG